MACIIHAADTLYVIRQCQSWICIAQNN